MIMKNSWNGEFLPGMEELAEKESFDITGGESIWFWAGYAVGWVSHVVSNVIP